MAKNILKSKTFWLNVIGIGAQVTNIIPPEYGVPALGILNIANRFLTNQPVTIQLQPNAPPTTPPPPTTPNFPAPK